LPSDPSERHAQLRDYFCDKDAIASARDEYWSLDLEWSNEADRYVDPRLDEGLAWWGCERYSEMALARKRRGRVLLALNDTWTLESWSHWMKRTPRHSSQGIVVLHVDDHKDLAAPRLFQRNDGWYDPISREKIALNNPESITLAIESGAIGMGSFLTPFLHSFPGVNVRHLCQAPKCVTTTDSLIQPFLVNDTLLEPNELRPAIQLLDSSVNSSLGRYRLTNDLDMWLQNISSCGKDIFLHIDMDYFCNRFDGDSDSIATPGPHNPPLENILTCIDDLSLALKRHELTNKIVDTTVAFSPGFFPAEFWAPACNRLLDGLGERPWNN